MRRRRRGVLAGSLRRQFHEPERSDRTVRQAKARHQLREAAQGTGGSVAPGQPGDGGRESQEAPPGSALPQRGSALPQRDLARTVRQEVPTRQEALLARSGNRAVGCHARAGASGNGRLRAWGGPRESGGPRPWGGPGETGGPVNPRFSGPGGGPTGPDHDPDGPRFWPRGPGRGPTRPSGRPFGQRHSPEPAEAGASLWSGIFGPAAPRSVPLTYG